MDKTFIQFSPGMPSPRWQRVCPECDRGFSTGVAFCPFDGASLREVAPSELTADPLLGTIVDDRYQVLEVLGSGAMGTVYRVRHVALPRELALKVLRLDLSREENLAARFVQEAKAAASVTHPGVVQITDFGTLAGGRPYFVMELVGGRALGRILAEGVLSTLRTLRIARQIAEALGAAHQQGIIHRDLKPDNIIVDEAQGDLVKVLDFGLARVAGTSTLTCRGIVFGTPHYMSPEQAGGEAVDDRSDLYALGVVIYQMLTGTPPFAAESYLGVLSQHRHAVVIPPSVLLGNTLGLEPLEQIVMRCLSKAPRARFQSARELCVALDDAARNPALHGAARNGSGYESASKPADAGARPRSSRSLGSSWARAGGFMGMLLAAGLGVWAMMTLRAQRGSRVESRIEHPSARASEPFTEASGAPQVGREEERALPKGISSASALTGSRSPGLPVGSVAPSAAPVPARNSTMPALKRRPTDMSEEILDPWR